MQSPFDSTRQGCKECKPSSQHTHLDQPNPRYPFISSTTSTVFMSSEMVNEGFWFSRVRGKQVRCRKDLEKEFFLPFLRRFLCVSWPVWTILQHYKPFTHVLICVTQSNPPQFRAPLEVPSPDNLTFIYFTIYTGQFSTSLRKPLKRQMSFCTFWREVAKIRA